MEECWGKRKTSGRLVEYAAIETIAGLIFDEESEMMTEGWSLRLGGVGCAG